MEELLNKLIEKGWKPFNVNCAWTNVEVINRLRDNQYIPEHTKIIFKTDNHWHVFDCNIRDLVSKSSGLWQFVCENGMYDYKMGEHKNIVEDFFWNERENCNYYGYLWDKSCWEYYVVESALCNEENLEKFLLDNIKIDGE